MGCNQSASVKNETTPATVTPASPVVEKAATPVTAAVEAPATPKEVEAEAEPAVATVEEVTPVIVEDAAAEEETCAPAPVEEEEAAPAPEQEKETPVVVEETETTAPVVVEKVAKKKKIVKKTKKTEEEKTTDAPAEQPSKIVFANDENAVVSSIKKNAAEIESAPAQEKRVAFAPRSNSNVTPKAPKVKSTNKNKKHSNVESDKMKEMTMAFQRLLTHADHLDAHLSTRNTYTQKA